MVLVSVAAPWACESAPDTAPVGGSFEDGL